MKKIYNLILLVLPLIATSQITLTSDDAPEIGDTYFIMNDTLATNVTVSEGSSSSQTFDYSDVAFHVYSSRAYVTSVGTAYASDFPSSTIAIDYSTSIEYFYANSTGFFMDGFKSPSMEGDYVGDWLGMPLNDFTYGSSVSNNPSSYTDISSFRFKFAYERTFEGDAFGILKTPSGDYSDVLRIKEVRITNDTTFMILLGDTSVYSAVTSTKHVYTFYEKGTGRSLATIVTDASDVASSFSWTDESLYVATSLNDLRANEMSVYPNPLLFGEILNFNLADLTNATIEIYNTLGQKVYSQTATTSNHAINIDLNAGMYFYQIRENATVVKTGEFIVK